MVTVTKDTQFFGDMTHNFELFLMQAFFKAHNPRNSNIHH